METSGIVVGLGFKTLRSFNVAFYSEREKSDKFFAQRLHFWLEVLLRAVNLRHGIHSSTSLPKEVIPRIFTLQKNSSTPPWLNPRTSDPVVSMITTGPPGLTKPLEISSTCVTGILNFLKQSLQEMRLVLSTLSGDQATVNGMLFIVFPASQESHLTKFKIKTMLIVFFETARAWSIMNLYPRVKLSTRKFTREFWNCCFNTSCGFGRTVPERTVEFSPRQRPSAHCYPCAQLSRSMQCHCSSTPSLFSRFSSGRLLFVSPP